MGRTWCCRVPPWSLLLPELSSTRAHWEAFSLWGQRRSMSLCMHESSCSLQRIKGVALAITKPLGASCISCGRH
jgi:hypothetical protein